MRNRKEIFEVRKCGDQESNPGPLVEKQVKIIRNNSSVTRMSRADPLRHKCENRVKDE